MSIKELKEEIRKLKNEIVRLQDENSSLWFMLDEIDKSNIKNPIYHKNIEEAMKKLKKSMVMTTKKIGEA